MILHVSWAFLIHNRNLRSFQKTNSWKLPDRRLPEQLDGLGYGLSSPELPVWRLCPFWISLVSQCLRKYPWISSAARNHLISLNHKPLEHVPHTVVGDLQAQHPAVTLLATPCLPCWASAIPPEPSTSQAEKMTRVFIQKKHSPPPTSFKLVFVQRTLLWFEHFKAKVLPPIHSCQLWKLMQPDEVRDPYYGRSECPQHAVETSRPASLCIKALRKNQRFGASCRCSDHQTLSKNHRGHLKRWACRWKECRVFQWEFKRPLDSFIYILYTFSVLIWKKKASWGPDTPARP